MLADPPPTCREPSAARLPASRVPNLSDSTANPHPPRAAHEDGARYCQHPSPEGYRDVQDDFGKSIPVKMVTLTRDNASVKLLPIDDLRVTVLLSGVARLSRRGATTVTEGTFVRGDAWMTPPSQPEEFTGLSLPAEPVHMASAVVRPHLLECASKGRVSSDDLDGRCWGEDAVQVNDLAVMVALDALLRAQRDGAERYYVNAVGHYLAAHIAHISDRCRRAGKAARESGSQGDSDGLTREQLGLVTGYMKGNLAEPICLEALAAVTGYSRYHFLRCFKAATGRTPYQYLMGLRIDVALRLLESPGNYSVAHIARQCGFPSPENFTRAFRQRLGVSPSRYVRSQAQRQRAHSPASPSIDPGG